MWTRLRLHIYNFVEAQMLSSIKNILICEDHQLIQLGLELSLKKLLNLESCQMVSTGAQALHQAKIKKPDLVFLDLGLPDMNGINLIEQLHLIWPNLNIVVITSCDSPPTLMRVKKLGVRAIMQKGASREHFIAAIQSLEKSGTFLDPVICSLLKDAELNEFTPREYEILEQITQGLSNQQIADKLGCALSTVRFHRANILQKANIRTGAELAAWFLRGKRHHY